MTHDMNKGQKPMKAATTAMKKSVGGAGPKGYANHHALAKQGGVATGPKKKQW